MFLRACVFLILSSVITVVGAADPTKADIDKLFAKWNKPGAPGCAYAVSRADEIILHDAFGLADLENDVPLSINSVFNIGSVSKQFTAASIVLLAQRGQLSLDDDVRKYVPEVPDVGKTITLRHILTHTSGLRDAGTLLVLAGRPLDNTYSEREWLKLVSDQKRLNNAPGERFEYVNTGYYLLGLIVKRVTKQSLQLFEEENIFKPLDMRTTHVHDSRFRLVPKRAGAYAPGKSGFDVAPTYSESVGGTGVMSTVDDLMRWSQNFQHNKLGGEQAFANTLETHGKLNDGYTLQYASGQYVTQWKGLRVVQHGGWDGGYKSALLRFPDQQFAVVILCNNMGIEPNALSLDLAGLFLKDSMRPELLASAGSIQQISDDESAKLVGRYLSQDGSRIRRIERREGKLFYVRGPGNESEVRPLGASRFAFVPETVGAELKFEPATEIRPARLISTSPYEPSVVLEAFTPKRYTLEELQAFSGKFLSDEFPVNLTVALKAGKLVAQGGGIPEIELTAVTPDLFVALARNMALQLRFERDKSGKIEKLNLSTDRARNLYFMRDN